jgi:hypothetical protein
MAVSRGPGVIRDPSGIFPCPLPLEYAFLEHGIPRFNKVNMRHPHNNTLILSIPAWDHQDGAIHYGLFHTACAIVADNRHDGYLSVSRDCQAERLTLDHDDLLPSEPANYYFHVPNDPNYPIVPSFEDWKFPELLPTAWRSLLRDDRNAAAATAQSNFSSSVRQRDLTCRVSLHSSATEVAHLCPAREESWYIRNEMNVWNDEDNVNTSDVTKDVANCLLLRSDLHKTFDDRSWVFFPKGADHTVVVHFLRAAHDQAALYHNVSAHPLGTDAHFLYARFAWAIFVLLAPSLYKPDVIKVKMLNESKVDWQVETIKGIQLRQRVNSSRSRSPTKRSRQPDDNDAEHDGVRTAKKQKLSNTVGLSFGRTVSGPSLPHSDGDFDYNHHIRLTTSADPSLEAREIEHDLTLLPRIPENYEPRSWYPGWRRVARLKAEWVDRDRARSLVRGATQPAVGSDGAEIDREATSDDLPSVDGDYDDDNVHGHDNDIAVQGPGH